MFDQIAKQLELQTLGKGKSNFKISKQEFDDFCKYYLFNKIKGDTRLGKTFCEKYDETNYVLSILVDDNVAKTHIEKFYIE